MAARTCLAIVLAAGEGTRMRSPRPKVLHAVAGKSLLGHVLVCHRRGRRSGECRRHRSRAGRRRRGSQTGFAGRRGICAAGAARYGARGARGKSGHERAPDDILVVYGDTPLIRPATLARLRAPLAAGAAIAVLAFRPADPTGYGRLVMAGDELLAIREEADASAAERAIGLCNGGLMAFAGTSALAILERIGDHNRKREFYLTDESRSRAT